MDEKQVPIFEEIFGVLDNINNSETDGLTLLANMLALPDEQFDAITPTLMDSIAITFNSPEARVGFAQMVNQQGLHIEDFSNNLDEIVAAVSSITADGVELSENKKDFLKYIFMTFVNTLEDSNAVSHRIITIPIELCREYAMLYSYSRGLV